MTKKVKILIVEDEQPIAKALQLKLNHVGFEADIASDGQEALEVVDKGGYDLMILDLVMPRKDGFEVLEELSKKKKHPPVIVATNLSQEEDLARAKKLGAKDYFVKADTPIADLVVQVEKNLK
ncbi:response regulator [Candidatus Berkelbacteria bacterium]|nr:response regulator [Candidatus Berkelbacteria bacterium]